MDLKKLEILTNKYIAGESSLNEEKDLRELVRNAGNSLPDEYRYLEYTFYFIETEKYIEHPQGSEIRNLSENPKRKIRSLIAIAASMMLLLSIGISLNKPTYVTQQLAKISNAQEKQIYIQTKEALLIVAQNLKRGENEINNLAKINQVTTRIIKNR